MNAVFLDRDGVINSLVYHKEAGVIDSPFTPTQFRLLPRVGEAIKNLNQLGLAVVMVSNQPGIAKGHLTRSTFKALEAKMLKGIARGGGRLDGLYYCLHHPQARVLSLRKRCRCRKPGIEMLQKAASDLGLSLSASYMVGDAMSDIAAGKRAGCHTIFVGRWKCEICQFSEFPGLHPDWVARDLWEASQIIKSHILQTNNPTTLLDSPKKLRHV